MKESPPGGCIRREARAGDRNQPTAIRETRQCGSDMAKGGAGAPARDVRRDREGRIHQRHARREAGPEVIVDLRGVELRDGDGRKEGGEQFCARLGQLVQDQRTARDLGKNGEQACAGRWLEHPIAWRDGGGDRCGEAERDRRRELLKGLALNGTARVGWEKSGDPVQ